MRTSTFFFPRHIALDQRDMLAVIDLVLESDQAEIAVRRGQHGLGHALDQSLRAQPIGNNLGDRDEAQIVVLREDLRAADDAPWCRPDSGSRR